MIRADSTEPQALIAELQLAFILVLNLSSFGALQVYKRIALLVSRSADMQARPEQYVLTPTRTDSRSPRSASRTARQLYLTFLHSLSAQIAALPDGVFDTELPEMDVWLLGEIGAMRSSIRDAFAMPGSMWRGEGEKGRLRREELEKAWGGLVRSGQRFGWELELLDLHNASVTVPDEESEEEGEYAPVVVDM